MIAPTDTTAHLNVAHSPASYFFTDSDYFPQLSPRLEAVRPRLLIDDVEEDSLSYVSDTDEELDLVSPRVLVAGEAQATGLPVSKLATVPEVDLVGFEAQMSQTTAAAGSAKKARVRKRFALPIIIEGGKGSVAVMACPDTGSDDNIISLGLAKFLQLQMKLDEENKEFSLANGKIVKSLGEASLRCSFGAGNAADKAILECTAYVFETLVVPAIIGAVFLDETETFTKHRSRLVEQIVQPMQALRVNNVGKPKRGLICRLDAFVGCANADTGSDLDLISPQFAKKRGFNVREAVEKLEFADGSSGYTSGIMETTFAVGNVDVVKGFVPRGATLDLEFFVLDSLTSDILVGHDTLQELDVLSRHGDLFIHSLPQPGQSDCNIIRHIGTVERAIKSTWKSMKITFTDRTDQSKPGSSPDAGDGESEREQLLAVQRENAQQETRNLYDLPPPLMPPSPCNSNRPLYCPIKSCPRSEGGKGFKLKGELLRHGLGAHNPSGYRYICPFCPDSERIYTRSDNLMRHVRVHHADIEKNDPLLIAALRREPTAQLAQTIVDGEG